MMDAMTYGLTIKYFTKAKNRFSLFIQDDLRP